MTDTFWVTRRPKQGASGVAIEAEDGLEAVSLAYPELNFETQHVSGATTYVLDVDNNVLYEALRVDNPLLAGPGPADG